MVLTLGAGPPDTVTVPELEGLTASQANRKFVDLGLNLTVEGSRDSLKSDKIVVRQSVAAGTLVPRGTVITLYFPYEVSIE